MHELLILNLSETEKLKIIDYSNLFEEFSELITQIGNNEDLGLRREMRDHAHMIENEIKEIKSDVTLRINSKIESFELQIIVILISGMTLFSISFFFIIKGVFKKIRLLSEKVIKTDLNNLAVAEYYSERPKTRDELDWLEYYYNKSVLTLNQSFKDRITLKSEAGSANEALKFRKEFLAKMAHELRTPLNGIIGIAEIINQSKKLDPETQKQFDYLSDSADDLLAIVNDTLDLSKLEEGKINLNPKPYSLQKILKRTVKLYQAKANEKGLNILYSINQNVPDFINIDAIRLNQILNNLVSNSIKFTNEGGIQIKIETELIYGNHYTLRIKVEDSGKGIPNNKLEILFKKYKQLEEDEHKLEGTGLGLAICKELSELMGGTIKATSEIGKGSQFIFTIKTQKVEPEDQPLNIQREFKENLLLNILLVDDKATNRVVAKLMLQKMGCSVTEAKNGLEALEKAKSLNFDMVLMDINMPVMNGFEATKRIKEEVSPTPIIIGLSANVMEGDSTFALKQGMDDYLGKPFKYEMLQSTILRHINPSTPPKLQLNT